MKKEAQVIVASAKADLPLRIMISGAPASGKGTQCELITKKYNLVHIAAGDLLRAEIASGSENGKQAKEYMEKGQLVPDEIVVMMVKDRLMQPDSLENGWLLDGYPRSSSQATALKGLGFEPDIFIVLEVPEEILVERVAGRRLDPVTGKIYHMTYSPPETDEIAARLTQRFDDTEEKVKLRLKTHNQNVEAVLSMYEDITLK
ncbi:Adenylate kinase 2, chloroplastic [Linum perenne]